MCCLGLQAATFNMRNGRKHLRIQVPSKPCTVAATKMAKTEAALEHPHISCFPGKCVGT